MCDFMCDEKGNIIIDFIGRYENLDADFEKACKAIGIKNKLPHLNKSDHDNYRQYYTNETQKIVEGWVKKDLEMFNYDY